MLSLGLMNLQKFALVNLRASTSFFNEQFLKFYKYFLEKKSNLVCEEVLNG